MGRTDTRSQVTVQSVNARLDEMAAEFKSTMDAFKSEFIIKPTSDSTEDRIDTTLPNFEIFQETILKSMNELREQVRLLKEQEELILRNAQNAEIKNNQSFLLFYGIKENNNNNLYESILQICTNKLNIPINKINISDCYRLGKKQQQQNSKPRPVVVQFCQRWVRDEVFFAKKKLKNSELFISELLTPFNLNLFKRSRMAYGNATWTYGGLVYRQSSDGVRQLIKSEADIPSVSERPTVDVN